MARVTKGTAVAWGDKLKKNGDKKNVTVNRKKAGTVERVAGKKGRVEYIVRDAKGKELTRKKDEKTATETVRKAGERAQQKEQGGGLRGTRKPAGHGKSPAKRAANRAKPPGSGQNGWLWKPVNRDK